MSLVADYGTSDEESDGAVGAVEGYENEESVVGSVRVFVSSAKLWILLI